MPRSSKRLGRPLPAWVKAWRKSGSPQWPESINILAVHWTDAASSHEDDAGPVDCLMVGVLKSIDEKAITLAMEVGEDKECRMTFSVPIGMVNRVFDIAAVRAFDAE